MPDGQAAVWRTQRRGRELAAARPTGLPQRDAYVGVLREGMAIDTHDVARPLLRHEHRPGLRERRRGRELERDRELPAGDLLGRGRDGRLAWPRSTSRDAAAALPGPAAPARARRGDGRRGVDQLNERWPGLRDRLCEPGPALRPHIHFYVDRERADARHAARAPLARRRDRRDQRRLSLPAEREVSAPNAPRPAARRVAPVELERIGQRGPNVPAARAAAWP